MENDELLTKQKVIHDQLWFAASEVSNGREHRAMGLVKCERALLTARSPRFMIDFTRFKTSNIVCVLQPRSLDLV